MEERAGRGLTGYRLWNVRPLFLAVLGFGIGIALCFYVRPHFGICVAVCLGFGVCMLWLARTGRRGFFVMLVLMMIGLGWGRTTFSLQGIVPWPEDGYIQGDIHEIQEQEGVYTLLLDHVALNGVQTNEQLRVRTKSQTMQYARPGDVFEGYAFSIWAPDMDSVWDRAQRYANHWDKLAWVGETEAKVTQTGFNLRYAPARMRDMVAGRIDALFGQAAPTVKGMVLGDKTDLSEEQKTVYERAGISAYPGGIRSTRRLFRDVGFQFTQKKQAWQKNTNEHLAAFDLGILCGGRVSGLCSACDGDGKCAPM